MLNLFDELKDTLRSNNKSDADVRIVARFIWHNNGETADHEVIPWSEFQVMMQTLTAEELERVLPSFRLIGDGWWIEPEWIDKWAITEWFYREMPVISENANPFTREKLQELLKGQ